MSDTPYEISPVKVYLAAFSPPDPQAELPLEREPVREEEESQEVWNTLFCVSQGKFHTIVLKGVRNIFGAL